MAIPIVFSTTGAISVGTANVLTSVKGVADPSVALSATVEFVDAAGATTVVVPLAAAAGASDAWSIAPDGVAIPQGGQVKVVFSDAGTGHRVALYIR